MNVNTTQLAKILGITRRYVNQLADKEGLPKAGRGKYELEKVVKWYIDFIRVQSEQKVNKKLEKIRNDDSQNRLNQYKADEALFNLLERQNRLIPTEEVTRTWRNEITLLKRNIFNVPNKVSHRCLTAQSKNDISEIIIEALNEALEKYANDSINISDSNTKGNN
jgi:phage terminase Nu1 subunit (DNA packaging protein)